LTIEEQLTTPVDIGNLIGRVEQFKNEGYRLVQIGCTALGDTYEINYSFDKDYRFQNIRITIKEGTEVPSISGMYWGAFIYENEMHDLFGIQVRGMNIDFKGTLFRTTIKYPFGNPAPKGEEQ
jgi:ech hydrogenase subunit D